MTGKSKLCTDAEARRLERSIIRTDPHVMVIRDGCSSACWSMVQVKVLEQNKTFWNILNILEVIFNELMVGKRAVLIAYLVAPDRAVYSRMMWIVFEATNCNN